MKSLRGLLPIILTLYFGILLIMLPDLMGDSRYSSTLTVLGPVLIIVGIVWYLIEGMGRKTNILVEEMGRKINILIKEMGRETNILIEEMGRKINIMYQSMHNLNEEGISEVSVISPLSIPSLLQNLDPTSPVSLQINFTQLNKTTLELVDQFSTRKATTDIRILLTGFAENTISEQAEELGFEKKLILDLLSELLKRKSQYQVRVSPLSISNSVLLVGSIFYILLPLEPRGTSLLALCSNINSELGAHHREFFENTWDSAKEY